MKISAACEADDHLSLRALPADHSTRCERCWPRSGCRLRRTRTGWWCLSAPGYRQRRSCPHGWWRPCIGPCLSLSHPGVVQTNQNKNTKVFNDTCIFYYCYFFLPEIWDLLYQWKLDADSLCVSDPQTGSQVYSACLWELKTRKLYMLEANVNDKSCYSLLLQPIRVKAQAAGPLPAERLHKSGRRWMN